ncbi:MULTISPECIES: PIN domain-containing protein [unclassified Nodularia (in: cyanobacteria)]|uniref:PIN domain-containing protein n=1 Tax=unclassified Nodularia (in: cyanobacteria) TaxID=2656917 RepID=UPI00187F55C5|nr:PIN domain-containing protein [Nodularia sp. LEGE 06071]MBE9199351.1 type II toxin-antitoxin system VapC family toxin [Nodularia sp. LEGE 06071]MCC2694133.1 type II toxin-antitoxin system VapC family toxin [Nodularia sp. LEGE 04288]
MPYLVDTNVLLRSVDLSHPMNPNAVNAISMIRNSGEQLHIVPQNLIEFWNVYTRPVERNGLGRSVTETQAQVNRLKVLFPLLLDTEAIYQEWERLVVTYGVRGVNVHDARLVAAMLVHGLTHILTFNISDFVRYSEITAVNPNALS